jgi:branched-chain amino acid transport system permease protein
MVTKFGVSPWLGLAVATALGTAAGTIVAIPLARLRGVFQALATLALVQIVLSITLNWVNVTDGALGINGIPKTVGLVGWLCGVAALVYLMSAIGSSSIGRAFDVIREDETVAVSLGISVQRHHLIAFVLSGAIAGLAGALHSYSSYSITPNEYGFNMVVMALAMVVLGGRVSVWGPIVGAVVLTGLPELLRGFQEYRMVVKGGLLLLTIIFLPHGVADTLISAIARKRIAVESAKAKMVTV